MANRPDFRIVKLEERLLIVVGLEHKILFQFARHGLEHHLMDLLLTG